MFIYKQLVFNLSERVLFVMNRLMFPLFVNGLALNYFVYFYLIPNSNKNLYDKNKTKDNNVDSS